MNATLIGKLREGQFSASAGATRGTVSLQFDGQTWSVGGRRIADAAGLLVVAHDGDAGTWHGFVSPEEAKTVSGRDLHPRPVAGVVEVSSSGGGDCCAAVVRIPAEGIGVLTSGYKGRSGWRLRVYASSGECQFDGAPQDYRAQFAPVEAL